MGTICYNHAMTFKHMPVRLAIVGGGAAGMFAAVVAAERRVPCVLVERKARLGSKVLMTANGRCNFTKDISADQFLADIGSAKAFVAEAIRECPPRQIVAGFRALNVPLRRMPDGRMFPADGKAATIVHAFGDLLRDNEVPVITNCPVRGIAKVEDVEKVEGSRSMSEVDHGHFLVRTKNFDILAENVLLATGGVSYPKLGSVGDGQNFAKALGHKIVPYRPGLIGLETTDPRVTSHAGQRFEYNGRVKIIDLNGRVLFDCQGEVDCERFGLSGAAIYNAQRFLEHYARQSTTPASNLHLEVWFGRNRIQFNGLQPRPLKEAIVTIGGVDTSEIDPHTMQSRLVSGLYFAGEVMDIDGPTGGYNLSLAFATARKAVVSIQRSAGSCAIQ